MILVVDDDAQILETIEALLRKAGYEVVTALNIDNALEVIATTKELDLALFDFWLEGKDAVTLFDKFQDQHPGTPFIMMSGGSGDFPILSSDAVARLSGAREFLQKPFQRKSLLAMVERLIA